MKKKVLSLMLVVVMIFGAVPVSFASNNDSIDAAYELYNLGLFKGVGVNADGTPNFELNRTPNRNEAITMLVNLLGKNSEALSQTWETPFEDVVSWAMPFVGYAYTNGITSGTSATTFGGTQSVTATQYLTFILTVLGYKSGEDFVWNKAWELSDQIGLTDGSYNASNKTFLRSDIAVISENALNMKCKNSNDTLLDVLVQSSAVEKEKAEIYKANPVKVSTVTLSETSCTMIRNQSKQLSATVLPENAYDKNVVWVSTNPTVATVSDNGLVRACEVGTTEICAISSNGRKAVCKVTVPVSTDGKNLNNLRHNAKYEVEVYPGVYWVPTVSLGKSSYTNEEIRAMLTDTPEQKRDKIDTVYEALQLYQIGEFYAFDSEGLVGVPRQKYGGYSWEQHNEGYHVLRSNGGGCADSAAFLHYLLQGDYDEVGFFQLSEENGGGHATTYIKENEWYYFIDPTQYRQEDYSALIETGDKNNICGNVLGMVLKTKTPSKIIKYQNTELHIPNKLAFIYKTEEGAWDISSNRTIENGVEVACHLLIGMRGISDVILLYDDPSDTLTYELVDGPQKNIDWSRLPTYDFVNMKQGEVQRTQNHTIEEQERPSVPQNITGTLEPTKSNGEYHWEINVAVTNETGSNLKLKEYSTVFYQGNTTIRDRLESGDGRNVHDVMDLSPGETGNWIYQDSVQENFDYVIYRLTYLDNQGKEVNYQYTFKMTNSTE